MPAPDPVLVAGAGIGGLTLALMLARRGLPVTILERRTALVEAGAGIQLSPNASRLLIDLGLGPALIRQASEPDAVTIRAMRSGRVIGGVALGQAMRERFGAPYLVIHRADLHTVLMDAVRGSPHVRMLVGRTVTGASTRDDRAVLSVGTAGGSTETYDAPVAIGADGLRSAVRRALGDRSEPRFQHYAAWRATVPLAAVPDMMRGNGTGLWLGSGLHLVHYPVAGGERLNVVAVVAARRPVAGWSAEGDAGEITQRFDSAAAAVRALIGAVTDWRVWSLHDRPAGQAWGAGRITLLGDAAHPVLPFLAQGGALAIEDAAVLAERLAAMPDDMAPALRLYESERRPRAARVQDAARANGRAYHLGGPLALARDLVIGRLGQEGMARRYDWLHGWRPGV